MQATIRDFILGECDKLIRRHYARIAKSQLDQTRFNKRTGQHTHAPESYIPDFWGAHKHFDPFYVRPRADSIAHSIAKKIRGQTYQLLPAMVFSIKKPGGGTREVTVFTIPDSAVSHYL